MSLELKGNTQYHTDAAAKIKESAKAKTEYQEIYFDFTEMDLITSEFKLHKECQKMRTRPARPLMDTTRCDPIGNFDKLVSHIDSYVMDLDDPLGMGTAVKLYLRSNTDKASSVTMKKRRQRVKKKLSHC